MLVMVASFANAGKFDQAATNILATNNANPGPGIASIPNSSVTLDFSLQNGEFWDGLNDPDNVIAMCFTGGSITGIEWDVTLETVGASWLSEATMQFTDSSGSADPNAINLTVGNGDNTPGTMTYNSGGIVDLTDNTLPDVVAAGDGILQIQFFESFDDNADAVDSMFTSGTVGIHGIDLVPVACPYAAAVLAPPVPVPTNNWITLALLMLALMFFSRKLIKQ